MNVLMNALICEIICISKCEYMSIIPIAITMAFVKADLC